MQGITIVGPGRLGGALALALARSGFAIDALVYRSPRKAKDLAGQLRSSPALVRFDKAKRISSPIVIIAVQDEEISRAAYRIADSLANVQAVFHTSGSLSSDELATLRSRGCAVASLHPLASLSNWDEGQYRFEGAYFCLEGDKRAVWLGKEIVKALGGHPFTIATENKGLYHASALTAAGHVTALFDIAVDLMTKTGVNRRKARKMLQPLLMSVAQNLERQDTPQALTGTYARADETTMKQHIAALRVNASTDELDVYLELAIRSIDLAEKAGADRRKLAKMRKAIKVAKGNLE